METMSIESGGCGGATEEDKKATVTPTAHRSLDEESPTVETAEKTTDEPRDNETSAHSDAGAVAHQNTLSVFDTVIVLTTFSLAGAIIAVPYSFGQFGYLGGPLMFLLIISLMVYFLNFLCNIAESADDETAGGAATATNIKTLGDVGYHLAGKKGRHLFDTFQMTNLVCFLPVGLETIGVSLNYVVNGSCASFWNIICIIVLYVLLQCMQHWHHMAWVGYVTFFLAASKALIFLPYAYIEYQEDVVSSKDYYMGPIQAFGNPQPTWYNYGVAITGFFYTFVPVFIMFEVRGSMKEPRRLKTALNTSALIQIILYLVAGVMAVVYWGWNVSDPITIEIPRGWLGLYVNIAVLLATILDYLIAAKIANAWFKSIFFPNWPSDSILLKLLYTLPLTIFAIASVLVIPEFDLLVGLLTSICIIGMNTWVITLAWELGGRRFRGHRLWMWILFIIGVAYNACGLGSSLYEIVTATYSWSFCD